MGEREQGVDSIYEARRTAVRTHAGGMCVWCADMRGMLGKASGVAVEGYLYEIYYTHYTNAAPESVTPSTRAGTTPRRIGLGHG